MAGPTALLIAKLHKLHDRVSDPQRPDRVRGKDAADIYRLMQNLAIGDCTATLRTLLDNDTAGPVTALALTYLDELFSNPRYAGSRSTIRRSPGSRPVTNTAPGTGLAIRALAGDIPPERVSAVCREFAGAIGKAFPEALGKPGQK